MARPTLARLALAAALAAACAASALAQGAPATAGAAASAQPAPGPLWDGACPQEWPSALKGVGVALTVKFPTSATAACAAPGFAGRAGAIGAEVSKALGAAASALAARSHVLGPNGAEFLPTGVSACESKEGEAVGTSQVILDAVNYWSMMPEARWLSELSNGLHLADACPADATSYDPDRPEVAQIYNALCASLAGGAAGARAASAVFCVKGAPPLKYLAGRTAQACFPGDATLTRADPETGARLGPVKMSDVRIGDAVACVAPASLPGGEADAGRYRDDEQQYVPAVCRVFGYLDADEDRTASFVALHYTDASGRPAKLRASPEHLVYIAPATAAATNGRPPAGGAAKRADAVAAGDRLLVAAESEGGAEPAFYAAEVTQITREQHRGAFAPLLTGAGLPIVDGAAAFSWVHVQPGTDPHPMQNIGEYMRHVRLWLDFEASLQSGCLASDCPCLDAPEDKTRPCARLGDRLADLPKGKSDYAQRSLDALMAAAAEGRTSMDYAGGISAAKAYLSRPWLYRAGRALGLKPHTVGIWMTNRYLKAPAEEAGAAGAEAEAAAGVAAARGGAARGAGARKGLVERRGPVDFA